RQCFIDGHRQPSRRPSPEMWRDTLADAERFVSAASPKSAAPLVAPARAADRPVAQPAEAEPAPRLPPVRPPRGARAAVRKPPAPGLPVPFFARPGRAGRPSLPRGARYAVGTGPGVADFDHLDLLRVAGVADSATVGAWQAEINAYAHRASAGNSGALNTATI